MSHRPAPGASRLPSQRSYCSRPLQWSPVSHALGAFDNDQVWLQGSKAELVFTAAEEVLWRVTAPTIAGRALFMTAGYLTWAVRNKSWSLSVRDGTLHFWWASLLFFVVGCSSSAHWIVAYSAPLVRAMVVCRELACSMLVGSSQHRLSHLN